MPKITNLFAGNKSGVVLLAIALIIGGISAQASGLLNTASGGYLICVDAKTKIVTHPGTDTCPKGAKQLVLGAKGAAGSDGLTGAAGLSGKDGSNGTNGKDGKTLWNGVKDPENSWGAPGDMFINSVSKTLFGPKNIDDLWPAGVSMVGPKGDQGLIGATGAIGPQGPQGPQGPGGSGPAGSIGVTGATGAIGATGSNATLTCAQGGTCVMGDTGPGGGKVFIIQTATTTAPWRYMEAAPNTWSEGNGEPAIAWCSDTTAFVPNLLTGNTATVQTAVAVGFGYSNTQKMLRGCTYGAANAAAAYNGGGKSNWHLPSKDELNACYLQRTLVGGFVGNGYYWSSSENGASGAWGQVFSDGSQFNGNKSSAYYVRPVRAF